MIGYGKTRQDQPMIICATLTLQYGQYAYSRVQDNLAQSLSALYQSELKRRKRHTQSEEKFPRLEKRLQ
jgi:hypothetical protein